MNTSRDIEISRIQLLEAKIENIQVLLRQVSFEQLSVELIYNAYYNIDDGTISLLQFK